MSFIKIYFSYIKMFIKARMEYRFNLGLEIFVNIYTYFITYVTYWILINKFGNIGGWDFAEISLLYGLYLFSFAVSGALFWFTLSFFDKEIVEGNLDIYLVRPIGILRQMICKRFGDVFIGQIIVALFFCFDAIRNRPDIMNFRVYLYMIFALVGAIFIQSAAMILAAAINFWFPRSTEIVNMLYYDVGKLTHYPLDIYPSIIRYICSFLFPWAYINYYPSLLILNKYESSLEMVLGFCSPFVGIVFFVVAVKIFHSGLYKYTSAGS